ncbi:hypothetical protein ACFFRR_010764 [Megaselia abdita]
MSDSLNQNGNHETRCQRRKNRRKQSKLQRNKNIKKVTSNVPKKLSKKQIENQNENKIEKQKCRNVPKKFSKKSNRKKMLAQKQKLNENKIRECSKIEKTSHKKRRRNAPKKFSKKPSFKKFLAQKQKLDENKIRKCFKIEKPSHDLRRRQFYKRNPFAFIHSPFMKSNRNNHSLRSLMKKTLRVRKIEMKCDFGKKSSSITKPVLSLIERKRLDLEREMLKVYGILNIELTNVSKKLTWNVIEQKIRDKLCNAKSFGISINYSGPNRSLFSCGNQESFDFLCQCMNNDVIFELRMFSTSLKKSMNTSSMIPTSFQLQKAMDLRTVLRVLQAQNPLLNICKWNRFRSEILECGAQKITCFSDREDYMKIWKELKNKVNFLFEVIPVKFY